MCGDCHAVVMKVLNGHIPDGARVAAGDTAAAYLVDRALKGSQLPTPFALEADAVIYPDVVLEGKTRVGAGAFIEQVRVKAFRPQQRHLPVELL